MRQITRYVRALPDRAEDDEEGIVAEFDTRTDAIDFERFVAFYAPSMRLEKRVVAVDTNHVNATDPVHEEFKRRMSGGLTPASKLVADMNKVAELGMKGDEDKRADEKRKADLKQEAETLRMGGVVGSIAPALPGLAIHTKPEQILTSALAAVRGEGYTKAVIVLAKEDDDGTVLLTRMFMAGCNSTYAKGLLMEGIISTEE